LSLLNIGRLGQVLLPRVVECIGPVGQILGKFDRLDTLLHQVGKAAAEAGHLCRIAAIVSEVLPLVDDCKDVTTVRLLAD